MGGSLGIVASIWRMLSRLLARRTASVVAQGRRLPHQWRKKYLTFDKLTNAAAAGTAGAASWGIVEGGKRAKADREATASRGATRRWCCFSPACLSPPPPAVDRGGRGARTIRPSGRTSSSQPAAEATATTCSSFKKRRAGWREGED